MVVTGSHCRKVSAIFFKIPLTIYFAVCKITLVVRVRFHIDATRRAQIAQLVEQRTENPRVAGSIPALGI